MKLKKLYWVLIILLTGVIVFEILDLRSVHQMVTISKSKTPDEIADDLTSLQNIIAEHNDYIANLEKRAIWSSGQDLVSWLAKQADDSGIQIIGLQYLEVEEKSGYKQMPFTLTLRGTYNPMGRFINSLERSPNTVRIDSLSALRKDSTPDQITMNLTISYFQRMSNT